MFFFLPVSYLALGRRVPDNELSDSDDEDDRRNEHDAGEELSRARRAVAQFKKEASPEEDEEVEIEEGHPAPLGGEAVGAANGGANGATAALAAAAAESNEAMDTK